MINGTILQCFHAYLPQDLSPQGLPPQDISEGSTGSRVSLWQHIEQEAIALAEAGFSALWLPPMTKASGGRTDIGYNAYDLYDLGEFDQCGSVETKYGSREQLLAAIAAAHSAALQVYGDVVLHRKHGGDGLEVLEGTPVSWRDRNRAMAPTQPIQVHSQFTFPGREGQHSRMTWRGEHFQLVNHNCLKQPANAEKYPLYQLKTKPFSTEIDVRLGNQKQACQEAMCEELADSALAETTALAEINALASTRKTERKTDRIAPPKAAKNAVKNAALACELDLEMPEVAEALGEWGQWFLKATEVDGLRLDGAKHMTANFVRDWVGQLRHQSGQDLFVMGDCWSDRVNDLHWYIAKTNGQLSLFDVPLHYNFHRASRQESYYDLRHVLTNTLMNDQPSLAVTFVDNHNSQPGQLLESSVADWFKPIAYAMILLRREGYPCVFAADYWGEQAVLVKQLVHARSHYAYGPQRDYFEQRNIIGWTRLGNAQHPEAMAVMVSNGHSGQQWMDAGKPNTKFVDITGHLEAPAWTNDDGWAAFGCPQRSVSVWVEQPEA